MKPKYLYLNTIGCQMNVYDSEQIAKRLQSQGYQQTAVLESADLVIVNTCSIRAKAEQKAFSFLGRLAELKRKKPGLIIGVGGCVAQQEGQKILQRVPQVDLVFGTRAIGRLPQLIERIASRKHRLVDVEMTDNAEGAEGCGLGLSSDEHPAAPGGQVSQFVTIMRGCDNFCTYCVVPYVRGREVSRQPERIVREIRARVAAGAREVTLLGQNVNSYGQKEGLCSFPELLSQINEIEGLRRIRFTTSHPKDLCDDLVSAFRDLGKLCRHIHLPVQSGSDRILKKMNRKYTRQLYLEKIAKLRQACPDIAITSDIIVGFPGECETDFKATLDLIETTEFDGLFAFSYSDRPNAPAAGFAGKVATEVKKDRLQAVLDLQARATLHKHRALVGETVDILVEGLSKKPREEGSRSGIQQQQWSGRTSSNKIVNFVQTEHCAASAGTLMGELIRVKIEKAHAHSLQGMPISPNLKTHCPKGDASHAA